MNHKPLVSVIIPTYNYAVFITEAIDSVLNSTFPNNKLEIIVVDDGSTDNTSEIVARYRDTVIYIFQENLGKAEGTRKAVEHAQGKYIFNLDADDFFFPRKIDEVVNIFESDPEIFHVGHPAICWSVDSDIKTPELIPGNILSKKILGEELLSYFYKNAILFGGGSTFAARADILKSILIPRDVDMYIDEYLLLAVNSRGGYSYLLEDALSTWRIHGKNFSANRSTVEISKLRQSAERNLSSVKAVFKALPELGVDDEIQKIYQLKVQARSLILKEQFYEKTWLDIMEFGSCLFEALTLGRLNMLKVFLKYNFLNRMFPSTLLSLIKGG